MADDPNTHIRARAVQHDTSIILEEQRQLIVDRGIEECRSNLLDPVKALCYWHELKTVEDLFYRIDRRVAITRHEVEKKMREANG